MSVRLLLYFYFALYMPELFVNLIVLLSAECNEALDYLFSILFEVNENVFC